MQALDILGNTKWRVNKRVLGVVESIWAGGGNIAGLVNCSDVSTNKKLYLVTYEILLSIQMNIFYLCKNG